MGFKAFFSETQKGQQYRKFIFCLKQSFVEGLSADVCTYACTSANCQFVQKFCKKYVSKYFIEYTLPLWVCQKMMWLVTALTYHYNLKVTLFLEAFFRKEGQVRDSPLCSVTQRWRLFLTKLPLVRACKIGSFWRLAFDASAPIYAFLQLA